LLQARSEPNWQTIKNEYRRLLLSLPVGVIFDYSKRGYEQQFCGRLGLFAATCRRSGRGPNRIWQIGWYPLENEIGMPPAPRRRIDQQRIQLALVRYIRI
jgi:hypothetical protein